MRCVLTWKHFSRPWLTAPACDSFTYSVMRSCAYAIASRFSRRISRRSRGTSHTCDAQGSSVRVATAGGLTIDSLNPPILTRRRSFRNHPKSPRPLPSRRRAGLVSARREGGWIYYRLVDPADPHAAKILQELRET